MNKLRGCITTVALFLLCVPPASAAPPAQTDTNYVRAFPGTITVRTYLGEKFSTYTLVDQATNRELTYHPNSILAIGLGVTIMGIGLNFSTRLPMHDPKIDKYGETSRYDIQVHKYGRKLMLDAYFQRYRGFHVDKDEVTTITNPEEYPYFANLEGRSIGVSALYVFNGERFSLRALASQQEWQTKSAGSPLLGGSIITHRFKDNDSSVIPRYYKYPDFLEGAKPVSVNYYGIAVNGGYAYTLVLDKAGHYFLAGAADIGLGVGQSSVEDTLDVRTTTISPSLTGNLRVGLGYNSEKWFAGLYGVYHTDYYSLPYDQSFMHRQQGIVRLVVARRLATKKSFLAKQPKVAAQPEPAPLSPEPKSMEVTPAEDK